MDGYVGSPSAPRRLGDVRHATLTSPSSAPPQPTLVPARPPLILPPPRAQIGLYHPPPPAVKSAPPVVPPAAAAAAPLVASPQRSARTGLLESSGRGFADGDAWHGSTAGSVVAEEDALSRFEALKLRLWGSDGVLPQPQPAPSPPPSPPPQLPQPEQGAGGRGAPSPPVPHAIVLEAEGLIEAAMQRHRTEEVSGSGGAERGSVSALVAPHHRAVIALEDAMRAAAASRRKREERVQAVESPALPPLVIASPSSSSARVLLAAFDEPPLPPVARVAPVAMESGVVGEARREGELRPLVSGHNALGIFLEHYVGASDGLCSDRSSGGTNSRSDESTPVALTHTPPVSAGGSMRHLLDLDALFPPTLPPQVLPRAPSPQHPAATMYAAAAAAVIPRPATAVTPTRLPPAVLSRSGGGKGSSPHLAPTSLSPGSPWPSILHPNASTPPPISSSAARGAFMSPLSPLDAALKAELAPRHFPRLQQTPFASGGIHRENTAMAMNSGSVTTRAGSSPYHDTRAGSSPPLSFATERAMLEQEAVLTRRWEAAVAVRAEIDRLVAARESGASPSSLIPWQHAMESGTRGLPVSSAFAAPPERSGSEQKRASPSPLASASPPSRCITLEGDASVRGIIPEDDGGGGGGGGGVAASFEDGGWDAVGEEGEEDGDDEAVVQGIRSLDFSWLEHRHHHLTAPPVVAAALLPQALSVSTPSVALNCRRLSFTTAAVAPQGRRDDVATLESAAAAAAAAAGPFSLALRSARSESRLALMGPSAFFRPSAQASRIVNSSRSEASDAAAFAPHPYPISRETLFHASSVSSRVAIPSVTPSSRNSPPPPPPIIRPTPVITPSFASMSSPPPSRSASSLLPRSRSVGRASAAEQARAMQQRAEASLRSTFVASRGSVSKQVSASPPSALVYEHPHLLSAVKGSKTRPISPSRERWSSSTRATHTPKATAPLSRSVSLGRSGGGGVHDEVVPQFVGGGKVGQVLPRRPRWAVSSASAPLTLSDDDVAEAPVIVVS